MNDVVRLAHGSGGRVSAELIQKQIAPVLLSPGELDDAAVVNVGGAAFAFTTDSFVVDPLFFPGGDIGRLAVFGTVNDVAVQGGKPAWLSLALIAVEGLPMETLLAVVQSAATAAAQTGVKVVTGDTKVVEQGGLDGLIVNTAGIGQMIPGADLAAARVRPGDAIIVSGDIGAHEVAVLSHRHGLGFDRIKSDCGPIDVPTVALLKQFGGAVKWMRDPTRGGLATVLNELAVAGNMIIEIEEKKVPIDGTVLNASEMLGLDPFYLACEGRFVAVVEKTQADQAVECLKQTPQGEKAAVVGMVGGIIDNNNPQVQLSTRFGSRRILRYLAADQQPRIC